MDMPFRINLSVRYPFLAESGIAVEFFHCYRNKEKALHVHNYVEIVYFASGSGIHLVGADEYPVKEGTLAIIHFGQAHAILTEGMSIYNIYIDPAKISYSGLPPDFLYIVDRYIPLAPGLKHQLNSVRHFLFPPENCPVDILNRMYRETGKNKVFRVSALRNLFNLFVLDFTRILEWMPGLEKIQSSSERRLEDIRIYIEKHLEDHLSPGILSREFGFNKEYLCRRFKKYTGKTICGYVVSARIQKMLPSLRENRINICETAFAFGFNDLSYFNRCFKRVMGITPSEYRKNCQSGAEERTLML